jgi:hypothetical protein
MPAKRIPLPTARVTEAVSGLMTQEWYDFLVNVGQPARLGDYPSDVEAAAAGVPLYGLYRTGSTVKVRVT